MNSVFGGHGIQTGVSPQEELGYLDSPETAVEDWRAWAEDPHVDWMRTALTMPGVS